MNPECLIRKDQEILTQTHQKIQERLRRNSKSVFILSDLDDTLCGEHVFIPTVEEHIPVFSKEFRHEVLQHTLIVATGRLTKEKTIPLLWQTGIVHPCIPIITENGGAVIFPTTKEVRVLTKEFEGTTLLLERLIVELEKHLLPMLPTDQQLVTKLGSSIAVLRLQNNQGVGQPQFQAWLCQKIKDAPFVLNSSQLLDFSIRNTRSSVTIQHKDTSKGKAFEVTLKEMGISRSDIFVIGMGDAENDKEIFESADLSIGMSEQVRSMSEFCIPNGSNTIVQTLKLIRTAKQGWSK